MKLHIISNYNILFFNFFSLQPAVTTVTCTPRRCNTLQKRRKIANFYFFCSFSLHEIGYYDTRNSIDYILNTTAKEDLIYMGHSEGTTDFYILVSMFPEYNRKIRVSVNFAPVVFINHSRGLILHTVSPFERIILVSAQKN